MLHSHAKQSARANPKRRSHNARSSLTSKKPPTIAPCSRRAGAAAAPQRSLRSRSALAWFVRFTAAAERQLGKLDRPVQRRVLNILDEISQGNPRERGKAMQGDRHAWIYRVGEWRIICDLVDAETEV